MEWSRRRRSCFGLLDSGLHEDHAQFGGGFEDELRSRSEWQELERATNWVAMARPRRVRSATRVHRGPWRERAGSAHSILYSLYLDSCHVEQQVCGCLESCSQLLVPLHPCGSIPRLMPRFISVFCDPENSR